MFNNLDRYVKNFEKENESDEYLPKLVAYIREFLDKVDLDPVEFFGWEDDIAEDFYSWGHNSRWANTFLPMLQANLDEYVSMVKDTMTENDIKDFSVDYMYEGTGL